MAQSQLYSLAFVTVNGKLLTEEADVTVNRNTGAQPVNTVAKGFAGVSQGAATVEIDVTNAVPSADFELDAGPFMESLQDVEIGVIVAGKQMIAKGFILSDTFAHGVGKESSYSFKFHGAFAKYE